MRIEIESDYTFNEQLKGMIIREINRVKESNDMRAFAEILNALTECLYTTMANIEPLQENTMEQRIQGYRTILNKIMDDIMLDLREYEEKQEESQQESVYNSGMKP